MLSNVCGYSPFACVPHIPAAAAASPTAAVVSAVVVVVVVSRVSAAPDVGAQSSVERQPPD